MVGTIGWLFLLVKGYFYLFCIKKRGPEMRQGKKDGSVTSFLRNQPIGGESPDKSAFPAFAVISNVTALLN